VSAFLKRLANSLKEDNPQTLRKFAQLIEDLGEEEVSALLTQALDVEAQGGIRTKDGSRQRTLGGIFFLLAKRSGWLEKTPPAEKQRAAKQRGEERVAGLLRQAAERAAGAADALATHSQSPTQARRSVEDAVQTIGQLLAEVTCLLRPATTRNRSSKARRKTHQKQKAKKLTRVPPTDLAKYARKLGEYACVPLTGRGEGIVLPPVGGKKPGSHRDGRHS
jgi:hypothetical protein